MLPRDAPSEADFVMGYVVLVVLLIVAGVLVGYRLSWMDAYEKGRKDAATRAGRAFDTGVRYGRGAADIDRIVRDYRDQRVLDEKAGQL